ncbi:MAG: N-(5'-phosphoribosyl)anthranilate isomerase [Rhizobiales bacterium 65-9]|nr:phosphoribosylanthranilate isomerase [Hyphomicrobiales bacterium]OJY35050.1 MAG: N-(5'-phosphoribosyl)anthranilate isomerase [Rhizobiales bacterium 65-9]
MSLLIKICGLSTPETLDAALDAGADMVGLNFHPRSPRSVTLEQAAALARRARGRTRIVALVVDLPDSRLDAIRAAVVPDLWQLHGSEPPERIAAIRASQAIPVMKAIGVSAAADLAGIAAFAAAADHVLLDAKPPKDAAYPGGHGRPFDWALLKGLDRAQPFLLSGGLTPDTVGAAVRTVRGMGLDLAGVDVSSGVESAPGVKDAAKIRAFIAAARAADQETSSA